MTNQSTECSDPVARFAAELRALREQAGSPTFRELAKITHYSASTLAEATAGRRLPTEAVAAAFARACGADPDAWAAKVREAAAAAQTETETETVEEVSAEPAPAPVVVTRLVSDRRVRRAGVAVAACGLLAAGALVGAALDSGDGATAAPAASTTSTGAVTQAGDGEDPISGRCTLDARLVDKVPILMDGAQIGALEFKYSPKCGAGWARAYRYPSAPQVPLAVVTIKAADGRQTSMGLPMNAQVPVYTGVIRPGTGKCLQAVVVAYPVGHAPITTSLPCEAP